MACTQGVQEEEDEQGEEEMEGNRVCPRFRNCRDIKQHGVCWCVARPSQEVTLGAVDGLEEGREEEETAV